MQMIPNQAVPDPSTPDAPPPTGREAAPRLADTVFGVIGGAAILLAVVFLLRGGPEDGSAAEAPPAIPQLVLLAPAAGGELDQPAVVDFDAGTRLELTGDGWMAGERHLHLYFGDTELMPAPSDIQPLGGTRYRWTLPRLPAGARTLRLLWSGAGHRSLQEGASEAVEVRLR